MKIAIIGTGYVGLVSGTCLAELGHDVTCVDVDENKIENLKKGILPIYEPGLKELVERNYGESRLKFTTSLKDGINEVKAIFIAVGTPQDKDGSADLKYVLSVGKEIGRLLEDYKVIITKSTVPVGTAELVRKEVKSENPDADFDMVSNPEFLREGAAVKDFSNPDRVVVGTDSERAKKIMKDIYYGIERAGRPIVYTDIKSSEIIKYASNAMLATRISFVNMLSRLCEKLGGDIRQVSRGMGLDSRIGSRFLHAGIGYGGSCFPKDVNALINTLESNGCDASILNQVNAVNKSQREHFVDKIKDKMEINGATFGIWGLSFKPKTDDMRESPAIDIINSIIEQGGKVKAFDPVAEENAKRIFNSDSIEFSSKPIEAIDGADALIIATEWDEFRGIDPEEIKKKLKKNMVFDGRNIYDQDIMEKAGLNYISIGRNDITQDQ